MNVARSLIVPFFLMLLSVKPTASQSPSAPAVAEPQYINSFSALDTIGRLVELEHQAVTTFHTKLKPLPGYANWETKL